MTLRKELGQFVIIYPKQALLKKKNKSIHVNHYRRAEELKKKTVA
jgi:hypothetical protein